MGTAVSKRLEDAGIDVGNATHVVAISLPGAVAYSFVNASLEQFVYRPIGFRVAGMVDAPGAPDVVAIKFQAWASSLVSHSAMWGMWWKFVVDNGAMSWVCDVRQWAMHNAPKLDLRDEQRAVGPYYALYFAYVWNSCYKDMLKSAGRKGGSQQMLFDLHHVITVGLVASSIRWGTWRAGVLTRLIHDVADIVLYGSKLRQALFETRGGPASALNPWWAALLGTWFGTRILLYGYLCRAMNGVLANEKAKKDDERLAPMPALRVQALGCWLMWILQIAFFKGISETAVNFRRTGGIIDDPFHGKTLVATRG